MNKNIKNVFKYVKIYLSKIIIHVYKHVMNNLNIFKR